ncbi:hypothetical protein MMC25_004681 [Agyrium rufum]|nr:hypothetical protein [Agyrium rufum]
MRTSTQVSTDWDLTSVIDLVYSLSTSDNEPAKEDDNWPSTASRNVDESRILGKKEEENGIGLGDFNKLWQFLGAPLDAPSPTITSILDDFKDVKSTKSETVSVVKGVRWHDQLVDVVGDKPTKLESASVASPLTSKAQRKELIKRHKEQLKAIQTRATAQKRDNTAAKKAQSSPSDDGSEPGKGRGREPFDRKSVIQSFLYDTSTKPGPPETSITSGSPTVKYQLRSRTVYEYQEWPASSPFLFNPSSSKAEREKKKAEKQLAAAAAQKFHFLKKLQKHFVNELQYLANLPSVHSQVGDTPEGVHVFVDASNIIIGFHDALKAHRGLPQSARIRRQPFSFYNFSLILSRGRPTAKRVLVGSDSYDAILDAKAIGYETNILDRVHKAKELTPRQKRYRNNNGTASATSGPSSGGSGDDTPGSELNNNNTNKNINGSSINGTSKPQFAPEKWVEQGVDELIHMKILESIVDADQPGTIVLATGDAAEAEYSGGFLHMVERALGKGWKVEIVSFKKNTSGLYRRREFRAQWGDRFKIIELDGFVEDLLGVGGSLDPDLGS